jgi:hypothetical protein
MAGVMIGIDPHKGSHTAVAVDPRLRILGQVRARRSSRSANCRAGRTVGGSGPGRSKVTPGLLLAQQLVALDLLAEDVRRTSCRAGVRSGRTASVPYWKGSQWPRS